MDKKALSININNYIRTSDSYAKIEFILLFFSVRRKNKNNVHIHKMLDLLPLSDVESNAYRIKKSLDILGVKYSKNKIKLDNDNNFEVKQDKKAVTRVIELSQLHKKIMLDAMQVFINYKRVNSIAKKAQSIKMNKKTYEYYKKRNDIYVQNFIKSEAKFIKKYTKKK